MTLPPTFVSAVAAVSQRSAGERSTSNQRCQFKRRHVHVRGTERHTKHRNDAARETDECERGAPAEASEAISTDSGLPSTEPTAQPIISFASVGARSASGTSMLTVAATCGV